MWFVLIAASSFLYSYGAPWDRSNDPLQIDPAFKLSLDLLPIEGQLKDKRLAWPGNHWANFLGGISHRWSAAEPHNFIYRPYTKLELLKLPGWRIDELSPAEKFDIYNGRYDYPTVKTLFRVLSPNENEWHGICHGYAPAALNHPEPKRVVLRNKDGIKLDFYSSDVAGLMSYYYAKIISTPVKLIGKRCNYSPDDGIPNTSRSACEDLNAGAFHVVLANKLGVKGESFVADIDRYYEVWNHLAVDFKSVFRGVAEPEKDSARGTLKRVQVETVVTYAAAIAPKFDPVIGTNQAEYLQNTYEYYLEIDAENNIIGGKWIGEVRPDFVWTQKKATFTGSWQSLNTIYRPVNRLSF